VKIPSPKTSPGGERGNKEKNQMVINREDVESIAKLSRLELAEEEKDQFTEQLDNIFEYVQTLSNLDTDKIEPTSHAIPVSNVFREDVVEDFSNRKEIINNGPEVDNNAFVVPKIS
jgi:aspartyl-tRNA(Asn)/glutamyl-tRNA(Gln) amidotransferase subunit C